MKRPEKESQPTLKCNNLKGLNYFLGCLFDTALLRQYTNKDSYNKVT